ncbi:MAG: hypothetical protein EYC70_13500 [Planctomycetota bacterium]|nr:MAG: hypothetical protein EYC70_13500 [Planctomycetota bacterium]
MKMMRLVCYSLGATAAAVLLAVLAVAALVPELRPPWVVAVPAALFALGGWLLFFLPLVLWEGRTGRRLSPSLLMLLGCAVGVLFPAFFLVINGSYFWEWHPGHPMTLSLLAVPVAAVAGCTYACLRRRSSGGSPVPPV